MKEDEITGILKELREISRKLSSAILLMTKIVSKIKKEGK